jgi:predicted ATPase/DNA-binding winged helix-turn-helix (wHTH) protein
VAMGGRALEILIALVERAGDVVSKQDLMASAWPKLFVEEANLRVQMTALRRILGDGHDGHTYIENVARQGYVFSGRVQFSALEIFEATPLPQSSSALHNLPSLLQSVIGREAEIAALSAHLAERRLVTIAGNGGVGKTTAAIEVGRVSLLTHGAVIVIDLARVSEPLHVESTIKATIAATLRIDQQPLSEPLPLQDPLLILDNCEHLLEATAQAAEIILRSSPTARVLATSREPLRATGEVIVRLSGLEVPPADPSISSEELLTFAASRLFVERAASVLGNYVPQPSDIPVIIELCRRFEGMPLAIELAVGRVDAYGVQGLGQRLGDAFQLLVSGRRTALPRHQTLEATLNWSYNQLSDSEKVTFSRLSVFPGLFSLDAGTEIASIAEPIWSTSENLASLVMKSLINADFTQAVPRYRLLETTRAYAREKLRERGEFDRLSRRHATYMKAKMTCLDHDTARVDGPDRIAGFATLIDDLRVCMAWCFGPTGDAELGAELAIASSRVWFELSLVNEARGYFERAAIALEQRRHTDPSRVVSLLGSLGTALVYTIGPGPEIDQLWNRALHIAESADDTSLKLDALYGTWLSQLAAGKYRLSLTTAKSYRKNAQTAAEQILEPNRKIGDRIVGISNLFLGRISEADKMFESYTTSQPPALSPIVRMQYDQISSARAYGSMALWLLGKSDVAMAMAKSCVEDAKARGHTTTLSLVLAEAGCPLSFYCGELDVLADRVDLLQDIAGRQAFGPWRAWGRCFHGALLLGQGENTAAVDELTRGLEELQRTRWPVRRSLFLCLLSQALQACGRIEEALLHIEDALEMCAASGEAWHLPELLRVKAKLIHLEKPLDALACLSQAQAIAQRNDMVAWQIRCNETELELTRTQTAAGNTSPASSTADIGARSFKGWLDPMVADRRYRHD